MAVDKRRVLLSPDVRRQQLLDAATWVFARKGYRQASIGDVIARAGVARGTFYLHFDGKQQIFMAIVERFHHQVKTALDEMDDAAQAARLNGARAMLQASFRRWLGFFAANRDAARVVLKEASSIDPRFEEGFTELRRSALSHFAARFRALQQIGAVSRTADPTLVAHIQIGIFDEVVDAVVLADPGADLETLASQLADFAWHGLRPDRKD